MDLSTHFIIISSFTVIFELFHSSSTVLFELFHHRRHLGHPNTLASILRFLFASLAPLFVPSHGVLSVASHQVRLVELGTPIVSIVARIAPGTRLSCSRSILFLMICQIPFCPLLAFDALSPQYDEPNHHHSLQQLDLPKLSLSVSQLLAKVLFNDGYHRASDGHGYGHDHVSDRHDSDHDARNQLGRCA